MNTTKEYALIVAGGKGTRIKSEMPKQFLKLRGKPIIVHTIEAFLRYSKDVSIILVLPEQDFEFGKALCKEYNLDKSIQLQKGGATRFQSVKNGLTKIDDLGLVAIHDGVRPLVSVDIIRDSFRLAAVHGSAVAAVSLKESIRQLDQDKSKAVDRRHFKIIQTPQTFDVKLIKKAYQLEEEPTFTDDASVAEKYGHQVFLFEGSYENIKITTEEDLSIAEVMMS